MKSKIFTSIILFFLVLHLHAQDTARHNFSNAFQEISSMLDGKQPLDFERAVFITENAYRDNVIDYQDFKTTLDIHASIIARLIKAYDKADWKKYQPVSMGIPMETDEETKENYRKALANWAIYTYLTDTTKLKLQDQRFDHLPFTYSNDDPFGSIEWKNSQVLNLLETQKGNCYALVTLFKIFSERFHSDANIVTAPQHVYIEHRDPKGDLYNVEVSTRSFPGTGSIQTLTYTTREALMNNIALRSLDLKQSIGLCLVYLAKGYEHKYKTKDDGFILTCAEKTLEHDAKNLNILLLKAQVYEQRVMKKEMPAAPYEKMLAELYHLGYRQMPDDMKAIILAKIQGRNTAVASTNKTPNPFASIGEQARYVTLSNGLFEELHTPQKLVRYGQTIFNTEKNKIQKFLEDDYSSYQVDPVVFALSVDPLTQSYPWLTPYQFASNRPIDGIDRDGLEFEPYWATTAPANIRAYEAKLRKDDPAHAEQIIRQHNMNAVFVVGGALSLGYGLMARPLLYRGLGIMYTNPELVIGTTGLVASVIDPNPYSDYQGGLDDLVRGVKLLFKSSKGVEKFVFNTNRLKFFFGKGTGTAKNIEKSIQRGKDFIEMGIEDNTSGAEKIIKYMDKAMDAAIEGPVKLNPNSGKYEVWKVVDVVEDGVKKGSIKFGLSYSDEAMKTVPEVTTAIPMPTIKK
jgi:hypothetical protein